MSSPDPNGSPRLVEAVTSNIYDSEGRILYRVKLVDQETHDFLTEEAILATSSFHEQNMRSIPTELLFEFHHSDRYIRFEEYHSLSSAATEALAAAKAGVVEAEQDLAALTGWNVACVVFVCGMCVCSCLWCTCVCACVCVKLQHNPKPVYHAAKETRPNAPISGGAMAKKAFVHRPGGVPLPDEDRFDGLQLYMDQTGLSNEPEQQVPDPTEPSLSDYPDDYASYYAAMRTFTISTNNMFLKKIGAPTIKPTLHPTKLRELGHAEDPYYGLASGEALKEIHAEGMRAYRAARAARGRKRDAARLEASSLAETVPAEPTTQPSPGRGAPVLGFTLVAVDSCPDVPPSSQDNAANDSDESGTVASSRSGIVDSRSKRKGTSLRSGSVKRQAGSINSANQTFLQKIQFARMQEKWFSDNPEKTSLPHKIYFDLQEEARIISEGV